MTKAELLKATLRDIVKLRKQVEVLMSSAEIKDMEPLFDTNPVFMEGYTLPENPDLYNSDRFNHFLDMLSKTHTHLLRAQEHMLRLGVHHVRLETGTGLSQKMEENH